MRFNKLEAEVLFLILKLVTDRKVILVDSAVIEYENSLNPFPERKMFIEKIMQKAEAYQNLNEATKERALEIEKTFKIQPIDAMHVAAAESAHVEFFITSDYNVIRKYRGNLRVIKPLDFIKYYENTSR